MTIKERLAAALNKKGYLVQNYALRGAEGFYRIYGKFDDTIVCWEAWTDEKIQRHIFSYDTMTACVRYGFEATTDDEFLIQICANCGPDMR